VSLNGPQRSKACPKAVLSPLSSPQYRMGSDGQRRMPESDTRGSPTKSACRKCSVGSGLMGSLVNPASCLLLTETRSHLTRCESWPSSMR